MLTTVPSPNDRNDVAARLDRLERMVGRLVDLVERNSVVLRTDALAGPTPQIGTVPDRLSQALLEISEPEVLGALTRIATLAPQLEAAAHAAAAAPELLEEALDVIKEHVGADGNARTKAIAEALMLLSRPDVVGAVARLGAATPALAPTVAAAAAAVAEVREVVGPTTMDDNIRDLTRTVLDPEVMQSLVRLAGLVPQLEYAAFGAAALPELLDEALEVVREKTAGFHDGVPIEARLDAVGRAAAKLSRPSTLAALVPMVEKLTALSPETLDEGLRILELVSRPATRAALEQLVEHLPEVTSAFLALPTNARTLAFLTNASQAVGEQIEATPRRVGLFGMLRALRDPQVQATLGFGVGVAKRLGEQIETAGLPSGSKGQLPSGK
jgi:uncharacterized protein YjgD (DUF1641 family)